jgi:hypothetical protein
MRTSKHTHQKQERAHISDRAGIVIAYIFGMWVLLTAAQLFVPRAWQILFTF